MTPIYVTYTHICLNGERVRFAIECANEFEKAMAMYDLLSRVGVINIRVNRSGRGLPKESAKIFPFYEYINASKTTLK